MKILSQVELLSGTVSIRLKVEKSGEVLNFKLLTNTLISQTNERTEILLLKELKKIFTFLIFPKAKSDSLITIPLLFKT